MIYFLNKIIFDEHFNLAARMCGEACETTPSGGMLDGR